MGRPEAVRAEQSTGCKYECKGYQTFIKNEDETLKNLMTVLSAVSFVPTYHV